MKNIFAHTEPGQDYPAYISINKDDDGRLRVSVRSQGNGGRDLGTIYVSPETLEHMATNVLTGFGWADTTLSADPAPVTGPQFAKTFQTERGQIVAMLHQDSEGNPAVLFWFDAGIDGLELTNIALGFTDDEAGAAKARTAFENLKQDGVESQVFKLIDHMRAEIGGDQ